MRNLIPWRKQKNEVKSSIEDHINHFHREMNTLFDRFFEKRSNDFPVNLVDEGNWQPKVDISEGKKDIIIKAEIPGIEPKDLDISLNGRVLVIKGEKKNEKESKEKNYHRIERSYGYFNRTLELPTDVIESEVNASYKNGILNIELKKTKESETKTIKVKAE
ncbi:MAG: Hsp20/alpha crystallin family protein [Desulfobacterales bacterium]|nr:Hsp20/alpha crystallin family protein [Desulfobacterales bacterium]